MKARKPTYSNDRKAPRMKKGKFSKMVITRDLYKRFIKEHVEYEGMSWRDFYDTWAEIAERIRYHAVHNPLGIKLGSYTGEIKVQYLPYNFRAKDYVTSEKEGEDIPFLNINHKGKTPTIKWERRWAVKFNKILQFYAFDETREINNLAYEYMLTNPELRTSRNTLGGISVWRQKMKNYDKKTGD